MSKGKSMGYCKRYKCFHNKGIAGCCIIPTHAKNGECMSYTEEDHTQLFSQLTREDLFKQFLDAIGVYEDYVLNSDQLNRGHINARFDDYLLCAKLNGVIKC